MSTAALILLATILTSSPAAADPPIDATARISEQVPIHRDRVEGDFAVQGEYLGEVRAVDGRTVTFGLQVASVGAGRFLALGYQGGLPGNGWDQETTISWDGSRYGNLLVFNGPRGRIVIERGQGSVIDSGGTTVGQVTKIRRISATLGAPAPREATVLFDGTDTSQFEGGKFTPEGFMDIGAVTKMRVRDFQMHLEFRTPFMPDKNGQARGNSGIYIQRRYEVQILDSFGLPPIFNGCGALYRQQAPQLNMSFPPLSWQTYDIHFRAARWDPDGKKTANAEITVIHNGVPIHSNYEVPTKTGAGSPESPEEGPILFQNHGDPVQFRNVWMVVNQAPAAQDDATITQQPQNLDIGPQVTQQSVVQQPGARQTISQATTQMAPQQTTEIVTEMVTEMDTLGGGCACHAATASFDLPPASSGNCYSGQCGWVIWKGDYPF